ncbi:UNVERIFIED_ORG: hypothetical protein J2W87_006016, partial [Pseudomonas putida]|nr:hypothetical protein [Pseudomonas putida]
MLDRLGPDTLMVDVPPPSRASPLPQGLWMYGADVDNSILVGAGLPAKADCQATEVLDLPPQKTRPNRLCENTLMVVPSKHPDLFGAFAFVLTADEKR